MDNITISKKSAEVALRNLWEHFSEVYYLDADTRAGISALDEFVKALNAEELMVTWEQERQAEYQEMMAKHKASQGANN